MISTKKPSSITITIRDRQKNESKSITVYNSSVNEIVKKFRKLFG